jgi:hypothetical protein
MTLFEDATLLGKKILVTVVIYLLPISILVGGLLLTRHLLDTEPKQMNEMESKTSLNIK